MMPYWALQPKAEMRMMEMEETPTPT